MECNFNGKTGYILHPQIVSCCLRRKKVDKDDVDMQNKNQWSRSSNGNMIRN